MKSVVSLFIENKEPQQKLHTIKRSNVYVRSLKNVSLCKNNSLMTRMNAHVSQKLRQPYIYTRVMYNLYMFTDPEIRLKHR